jgi:hypothetical protein
MRNHFDVPSSGSTVQGRVTPVILLKQEAPVSVVDDAGVLQEMLATLVTPGNRM